MMRSWIAIMLAACAGDPEEPPICAESVARRPSQCGPTLDLTPINAYLGDLPGVQECEDAVALISGTCTGTLIAAGAGAVVVTAGHCVGLGDRVVVAFNVEAEPDGDQLVTEGVVLEWSEAPDYALIQLDRLPAITPTRLTRQPTDRLAIIQHPRGRPKVIAEGSFLQRCDDASVVYADLDTLVGSSGAGVLTETGALVGIHTGGDCREDGAGSNHGAGVEAVVEASAYLTLADLD